MNAELWELAQKVMAAALKARMITVRVAAMAEHGDPSTTVAAADELVRAAWNVAERAEVYADRALEYRREQGAAETPPMF